MHTSHCTRVKSHVTLWKRVDPCGRWWWMTVHQHTWEGNSFKPMKMCSLENRLWLLRYAGRSTPKMIKRWCRKTAIKVKNNPQITGARLERQSPHLCHWLTSTRKVHVKGKITKINWKQVGKRLTNSNNAMILNWMKWVLKIFDLFLFRWKLPSEQLLIQRLFQLSFLVENFLFGACKTFKIITSSVKKLKAFSKGLDF